MAGKKPMQSKAAARKTAGKRVATKSAKPRAAVAKSPSAGATKRAAKKSPVRSPRQQQLKSASQLIDARIDELQDWRGAMLARLRDLIKDVDAEVVEEWKWRGVPVWSHDGIVCTGESYRNVVKLTFFRGAQLADPAKLFNSSLEGNARRAIDFHEGDRLDEDSFKSLIRDAIALNTSVAARRTRKG